MPRQITVHEPDWIDVNAQLTAIGEDFGCICEFRVTVERDSVTVVARCRRIADSDDPTPVVQALARRPLKSRPNATVMCFSTALDCWRQLDRGVLGAASGGITHDWNGRPQVARRS